MITEKGRILMFLKPIRFLVVTILIFAVLNTLKVLILDAPIFSTVSLNSPVSSTKGYYLRKKTFFDWIRLAPYLQSRINSHHPITLELLSNRPNINNHEALLIFRYQSVGLVNPVLTVNSFGQTSKFNLHGTSVGVESLVIPVNYSSSQVPKGIDQFLITLDETFVTGKLRIYSIGYQSSENGIKIWKNGWFYFFLDKVYLTLQVILDLFLNPIFLIAFVVVGVFLANICPIDKTKFLIRNYFKSTALLVLLLGLANLSINSILIWLPLSGLLVQVWNWLPLPFIRFYAPWPIYLTDKLNESIVNWSSFLWPEGIITTAIPENVRVISKILLRIANLEWLFYLLTIGLALYFGWLSTKVKKTSLVVCSCLTLLIMCFVWLFNNSTSLPIFDYQRPILYLLYTLLVTLVFGITVISSYFIQSSNHTLYKPYIKKNSLILSLSLVTVFLAIQIPAAFGPATINSDESGINGTISGISTLGDLIRLTSFKILTNTNYNQILMILFVGLVGGVVYLFINPLTRFGAIFTIIFLLVIFRFELDFSPWDHYRAFRYPPFSKLLPSFITSFIGVNPVKEAFRIIGAIFVALSGIFVFLTALKITNKRGVAFGVLALYLFNGITIYWARFDYSNNYAVAWISLALLFFYSWIITNRSELLIWCVPVSLLAYFTRESAIIFIITSFIWLLGAVIFSPFRRTKSNLIAASGYIIGAGIPIFMWQKVMVGSWYGWVGQTISWNKLYQILIEGDRLALIPDSIVSINGYLFVVLILVGSIVGLIKSEFRLITVFSLLYVILGSLLIILMGRMQEYDGLSRFTTEIFPPFCLLSLGSFYLVNKLSPKYSTTLTVLLILGLVVEGNQMWPGAKEQCKIAYDVSFLNSPDGQIHGMFDSKNVIAMLPKGVNKEDVYFVSNFNLTSPDFKSIPGEFSHSSGDIIKAVKKLNAKHILIQSSASKCCLAKAWGGVNALKRHPFLLNPKLLEETKELKFVKPINAGAYSYLLFSRI